MNTVSEAVILMAGSGSRLRGSDETFLKPLVLILGRPLICYITDALIDAGINKINFIVGYQGAPLRAAIEKLFHRSLNRSSSRIPGGRNRTVSRFSPPSIG